MTAVRTGLPALLLCLLLLLCPLCDAAKSASSSTSSRQNAPSGKSSSNTTTSPPSRTNSSAKIKTQIPTMSTAHLNASTGLAPQPTGVPVVNADKTPYALNDSILVRSDLNLNDKGGLFFTFNTTVNIPIFISLSLCDGPRIPPYNTSDSDVLDELDMNEAEARHSTLVSMHVSDKGSIPRPGPNSNIPSEYRGYAQGGWTEVVLEKGSKNGVWIGVYPPYDARGMAGSYRIQLAASTKGAYATQFTQRPLKRLARSPVSILTIRIHTMLCSPHSTIRHQRPTSA